MKIAITIATQEGLPHLLFSGRLEEGLTEVVSKPGDEVAAQMSIKNIRSILAST